MNYRRLGRTGLEVSEIGYGAWGIGKSMWIGADDDESLRALERAIELGLNFIDTALGYGDGHSEQLVGQVVRKRSEEIHVATKIRPKTKEWPGNPGMRSLRNVERNVAVGDGCGLPPETVERLHAHRWERNFYAA